ncbi:MAG: DEAD/DEAH box helicase, partial [Verrucomicrobiota bacterium]|nr:DEAD/DEAH box helicase [Verrucomicrobiota bacterium]
FYSLTKDIGLIKPQVRMTDSSSDWFEFEIDFQSSSGDLISEDEIRKLINKGKYSKKSNSNKRLVLDKDRVDELFHTLGSTETKQRISGNKVLRSVSGKEALYIEDSLSKFGFRLPEVNNPFNEFFEKNFNGNLKSYQKEGVVWMNKRIMMNSGFILADEMGLGKTVQILALIASMNLDEEKVLIICPTSLIYNWKTEVKKFLPESSIQLYHGIDRAGDRVDSNIVISTYGTLLSDAMELSEAKFSLVVADEASYFKNDLTKTFKALESIDSKIKIALSGTPIENEISDLWSLMNIVNPNYLGSKENFKDYYVQEKSNFRHRVSPFVLRRLKKDVLKELPDKVEKTIFCDLSLEERAVYNNLLVSGKELISNLNKSPQGNETIQVLTLLLRLRQVCCDLRLIKNTKDRSFSSSKMSVLMNLIKNSISGGSKVIVFSQFVKMLKLIEAELKNESIPSYLLDGGTKSEHRNQMVKDFQDFNNCTKVFLISLKAGGYGLNLTAADTVIHFDPWWNPSVENQATDRVHRIGQSKIVNCYKLITNNTVEEKILSLQDKKRNLINMAIDEEVPDMRGLNNEDLKFVLN